MNLKKELQNYTKFLKQNGYLDKAPKNIMRGYVGEYIDNNQAINFTGSSLELKVEEVPTFGDWLKMYNFTTKDNMFIAHGKQHYYTEVYGWYKEWLSRNPLIT